METTRSVKIILMAIVLCTTAVSCSKNDDSTPEPQAKECSIVSASGLITATIDYTESGRVKTIVNGTERTNFVYINATRKVRTMTTEDGEFVRRRTMTLNENGQIIKVRTVYDTLGTEWSNYVFEYNGEQVTKMTYTNNNGTPAETTTFIWSNGNLTSIIAPGGDVTTLEYYEDKPARQGDYAYLSYLLEYGQSIIKNKNLLKNHIDSFGNISFEYDFDDEDKITSFTAQRGAETGITSFGYQCE